jgi:hypothetical protein
MPDYRKKKGQFKHRFFRNRRGANQHRERNDEKQDHQGKNAKTDTQRLTGSIQGLQILKPPRFGKESMIGDASDFTTWSDSMLRYTRREYGDIADIFKTGKYPIYQPPVPNRAAMRGKINRCMEKTRIQTLLKIHLEKAEKLESNKKRVFAVIMGQLSEESIAKIQATPGWSKVYEDEDPLELGKRVMATHVAALSADLSAIQWDVREKYNRCRQERNEPTADYLKRYKFCLKALDAVGVDLPYNQQQALDFLTD